MQKFYYILISFIVSLTALNCGYSTSSSSKTRIYQNRILSDSFTESDWENSKIGILPFAVDKRSTLPISSRWISDVLSSRMVTLGYISHLNATPPNNFFFLHGQRNASAEFSSYTNLIEKLTHEDFNSQLSNESGTLTAIGRKFGIRYLMVPLISYNLEKIKKTKRATFLAFAALVADAALYDDEPVTKFDLIHPPITIHDTNDNLQYRTHFDTTTSYNIDVAVWDCKEDKMVRTSHKEVVLKYSYTDWHQQNKDKAGAELINKVIFLTVSQIGDLLKWEKSKIYDHEDLMNEKKKNLSGNSSPKAMKRLTTSPMARD